MDRFVKIDWNPPLDDIIDNTFISDERLANECAFYKMLSGNFTDPFENMDEDYEKSRNNMTDSSGTRLKVQQYVPGIVRLRCAFPRRSRLNKEQQALCLRVLLKFSESSKPTLCPKEKEELQKYMVLRNLISEEQEEFLEFAKSQWHINSFKILYKDFVNLNWQSKLEDFRSLPRFCAEVCNIPFVGNHQIGVTFLSDCLHKGKLFLIKIPDTSTRRLLQMRPQHLADKFDPKSRIRNKVSGDQDCIRLAEENDVDVVISSSGLKCLVNNVGPKYDSSWVIPIVVKRHGQKNIVYINKPTYTSVRTIPETNTWVHKYILRNCLCPEDPNNPRRPVAQETKDIFDDGLDTLVKIEEDYQYDFKNSGKSDLSAHNGSQKPSKSTTKTEPIGAVQRNAEKSGGFSQTSSEVSENVTNKSANCSDKYVTYRLFAIGPEPSEKSELMKDNIAKTYKMLVRTKTDGYELVDDEGMQTLLLAPKLEHQLEFGAEVVTLEEALKQWVSLVFRPGTSLERIRISAKRLELIQTERRSAKALSNEIKRLYNINVDETLAIFHNICQHLTNLSPGNYVMRHTVKNGAFATVYKETDVQGKSTLDLQTICNATYQTLPDSPWIMIDKSVVTPALRCFYRMPAMFYPNSSALTKENSLYKTEIFNKGSTRRSSRNIDRSQQ